MAATGRPGPFVRPAFAIAAILIATACDGRRDPPEEDKAVVEEAAAPPAIEKPAPRPRPKPVAESPAAPDEPAPALSDEAQLAEDAAASGMTTAAPREESVE
jgi:hypothetical protein